MFILLKMAKMFQQFFYFQLEVVKNWKRKKKVPDKRKEVFLFNVTVSWVEKCLDIVLEIDGIQATRAVKKGILKKVSVTISIKKTYLKPFESNSDQ